VTDPQAPAAADRTDPAIAVEKQTPPPARRRRRWRWIVGTVVTFLVLGGLYLAAYLYAGTTIPRGTTVLGIDLGGQTQQEAEATLAEELPPIADAEITLLVEEDSYPVVPSDSGLNVDITATVRAAGPGASDPIRLVQVIASGGGPVDPVVVVDRDALAAAVDEVADTADRSPVEGAVAFDAGEVVATLPVEGRQVQRGESVDLVAESYLVETGPIPLPVETQPSVVTEDEVTRAVAEFAEPAMSGPIPLVSEVGSSELGTDLLSSVLSMPADDDGALVPRVDPDALLEQSAEQLDALGVPAVDASVRIQSGSPAVVAGQTGRIPDTATYAEDVLAAAAQTGDARTVTLPLVDAEPEFTTADAEASGVRQVVAEFTTYYPGDAEYRNINIGRAAELANNTFLKPGDTFSMNGVVGQRTTARGFVEGGTINNGRYSTGVGGGISQLATTLYNASYFAGFEDIEHHPHSFYIDRYPVGREATVSWGVLDLRFRNNTPHGAVVQSFINPSTPGSQGAVTVRIWSTPYWQVDSVTGNRFNSTPYERLVISSSDCRASSGSNGFDIVVTRTLSRDGTVQAREEDFTRYQPTPEVVCT
jgi:vancomycin resistance protein YoaR